MRVATFPVQGSQNLKSSKEEKLSSSSFSNLLTLKKTQKTWHKALICLSALTFFTCCLSLRLQPGVLRGVCCTTLIPLSFSWLISARKEYLAEKKFDKFLTANPLSKLLMSKTGKRLSKKKIELVDSLAKEGIDLEKDLSRVNICILGKDAIDEAKNHLADQGVDLAAESFFQEISGKVETLYFKVNPIPTLIHYAEKAAKENPMNQGSIATDKCFSKISQDVWSIGEDDPFLDYGDFKALLSLSSLKKYKNEKWAQFELKKKGSFSYI